MSNEQLFCADQSRALDAPLIGSASRIESWILLEYPYKFSVKAFDESSLPEAVKARLSRALDSISHSRMLLIKKKNKPMQSGYRLFLVRSAAEFQYMYQYQLDSYSDLLAMDIESILSGGIAPQNNFETDSIFLVCTNGKRDRCCARYGLPLFKELNKFANNYVWQSSHVGGHRFAANVISLPHGLYFGRMPITEARSFLELSRKGEIDLPYYRGRTCYTAEQQAAEYFLRNHTGMTNIDDLQLVKTIQTEENKWQVQFISTTGEEHTLRISSKLSDYNLIESCDSPQNTKRQRIYYMEEIGG